MRKAEYIGGTVDVFILVDLTVENLFIVPSDRVDGVREFTLTEGSDAWDFKDRFDLI
ncbi:hypothetical protein [Bradyrhizobium sp. C9]|uniref:hypothetical protein n=1 Tax=Bradyrhizobium sp. C9 TaxID=142585 RepID=UPI00130445CF|nr:hypothetical protein [Bradyrhizobium sp. C9]